MQNTTQHPVRRSRCRGPIDAARAKQEQLFDELAPMRRGLRWRCRGLVEDPAAEVDAAVWQQIAAGVTAPIDIYWGSVTALRRVKRRELRRRDRDPEPISNDLLDTWSDAARDDVDVVIDRMAIRQLLATLAPDPSPAARQWIAQASQGRSVGGAMAPATRMAGARWARRVREQAVEAVAVGTDRDQSEANLTVEAEPLAATAIAVGDTGLPREVVDAFQGAGGDLVRPSEWTGRFGSLSSFPEMVGSSTRVVEALQRIEPAESGDGWVRTDEMSWLVIDDRGRDELPDAIASRVGSADGWDPAASTDEGAECLNGPLDTAFGGVWTLQGCDYRRFADLLAIGLTRTDVSSDGPALIDPSVLVVSSTLGGRVVFSEVRLGQPGADGATLHLSAQVHFDEPVDLTTAVDELVVGVLPGWQLLRGDSSVLLSGPTGATWTITPTVAVFEWAGRW